MYITTSSGHQHASLAIEKAIRHLKPDAEILNIDSFNYTNPIMAGIINRTYMGIIKNTPEVWDYLYDNPKIVKNMQALRDLIHKFNTDKLKVLLDDFKPDAIGCTQAFPCGMVADYKKSFGINPLLVGVLTDYIAHSYWIFDTVDFYVVPSQQSKKKLIKNGVPADKIKIFGIPIDIKFIDKTDKAVIYQRLGLNTDVATILIMGGGQGLGPIKNMAVILDRMDIPLQILVVCGTNHRLYKWFDKRKNKFKKKILFWEYANNIHELMEISTIVITKPGGLTTAEALSKALPMIILNPIPGQETKNTEFLIEEGVAIKSESYLDAALILKNLLLSDSKLQAMRSKAKDIALPDSALQTARLLLGT